MNKQNNKDNRFCQLLDVEKPLLMAPMFLVSSVDMLIEAMDCGIAGAMPSLNFREDDLLKEGLKKLSEKQQNSKGSYGLNLVIKNNPKYEKHLQIIQEYKVPFVLTSLGNPNEVIELVHSYGGKVLCDVTNLKHAQKAEKADGLIAVGQGAGGHAGNISLQVLVPMLREHFPDKVIVGAGGVGNAATVNSVLALGADGVSAGTVFIASKSSAVSRQYKEAVIQAQASDIVMSPILSGTPATLIRSDYLSELEQQLKDKSLSLTRGIQLLKQAGVDADYRRLFVAGQSVQFVKKEASIAEIIANMI